MSSRVTSCWRIGQVVGAFGVILLVAVAARSDGITWGTIDTTHPNVGAILIVRANGTLGEFCSGTLVSARSFLTAGHCTDALVSRAIPVGRLRVSFSPNLFAPGAVYLNVSGYLSHPDYRWGPTSDPHDLGVVILARPVTGVAFGVPAPASFLDGLAASGAIQTARFINVGYGDNQNFTVTGDRQISYSSFRNLHDAWLYMSQNIHLGNGGTCYGDSGGPTFYVDPTSHAEYIVATTSWGDTPCKSTNNNYRVDLPTSLAFIQAMIAANP